MARSKKAPATAAKRRLARKAAMAAVEQYLGAAGIEMMDEFLKKNPKFAEALAEFQAALMLTELPDDATKH